MGNVKSDSKACAVDPACDTELSTLVDMVERQPARIVELSYRIEYILSRLTGADQEIPTAGDKTPSGNLPRLGHACDRTREALNDLEDSIGRLESQV